MRQITSWLLFIAFISVTVSLLTQKCPPSVTHKPEIPFSILNDEIVPPNLPILDNCELVNNPEKYDGKIVRVRAKLWFMIHGYSFISENCTGETKQTAVIFPKSEELGFEIENKIAKDTGLTEYHPWNFPEIIAVGRFSRVEPSRKSDSMEDNTYLHFELIEVEKASKQ